MTHLLATVYSPPPNSMVSCESTQSMEKSGHLLPRLLAPAAWLHPHTGNSVLLRGCVVSCLHIFALLMSFAVWSSPGHSCDVMSCVPKARRSWCVLQKTSSGQIKFRSSKEWSSWLQSSVNKPIEYTEWGVSKQKNIQSRLCINWPISTDERLIRISAFFFLVYQLIQWLCGMCNHCKKQLWEKIYISLSSFVWLIPCQAFPKRWWKPSGELGNDLLSKPCASSAAAFLLTMPTAMLHRAHAPAADSRSPHPGPYQKPAQEDSTHASTGVTGPVLSSTFASVIIWN